MKVLRYLFFGFVASLIVIGISLEAHAGLQTIGTATYGGLDYNLIYDNDSQLTWLDYTNSGSTWTNQVIWSESLNAEGVLTYNLNAGVSMNWGSNIWRLPTIIDIDNDGCIWSYSGTDCGYNVDTSSGEMAHLWYDELGNKAQYDTSGIPQSGWGLANTNDFQNLQSGIYWSATELSSDPMMYVWAFGTNDGQQGYNYINGHRYAIAVRSGQLAVIPEPISSTLFIVGGATLGFIRFRKKFSK